NGVAACAGEERRDDVVLAAGRWWDPGKNATTLDAAAARTAWPVFTCGATTGPTGDMVEFRHSVSLGALPHSQVRRLMGKCGIFVSSSIYEPFGLAALEAASAGTPLVLADIPTYRELWEGAAIFFAPRDTDALVEALDSLAVNAKARKRLALAAFRRSQHFTPTRQCAAMLSAYENATSIFAGRR
ncbi:glycosyltransferase family 4 protein, partial [Rhizobiaceae sp. 2RAB30]